MFVLLCTYCNYAPISSLGLYLRINVIDKAAKRTDLLPEQVEDNKIDVHHLLKCSTDQIASAGRQDGTILHQLEEFASKLSASIKQVKETREKEIKAAKYEDKREKEAEKEEQYEKMFNSNTCFNCNEKKMKEDIRLCAGLKHGYDSYREGLALCDNCLKEKEFQICAECKSFLCDKCNDTYKCGNEGGGCGDIVCSSCAQDDDYNATECEECSNWFCKSCEDKVYEKELCSNYSCKSWSGSHQLICPACESNYEVKKCGETEGRTGGNPYMDRGGCGQPLCDECVVPTHCGNPARLCDGCQHDHACECRTCYSYL